VADGSGNSLVVSGIVTYRVVDSARAALDMEHLEARVHAGLWRGCGAALTSTPPQAYVKVQAHAVLKRVASRFPYVTYDGSPSLITEQAALSSQLAALLQDKVAVAGVHVIAYELSDLAYAKEIAPQMVRATLLCQQGALRASDSRLMHSTHSSCGSKRRPSSMRARQLCRALLVSSRTRWRG